MDFLEEGNSLAFCISRESFSVRADLGKRITDWREWFYERDSVEIVMVIGQGALSSGTLYLII